MRIVTGSQSGASPDTATVVLSLTGTKGTTGDIIVKAEEGFFFIKTKVYFKESTYDDIVIECDGDLGDILVVSAGLQYKSLLKLTTPDWYIDYFTVVQYQEIKPTSRKDFPCYHWIGNSVKDVSVTSETGMSLYIITLLLLIIV